jgi:hypothetical protein
MANNINQIRATIEANLKKISAVYYSELAASTTAESAATARANYAAALRSLRLDVNLLSDDQEILPEDAQKIIRAGTDGGWNSRQFMAVQADLPDMYNTDFKPWIPKWTLGDPPKGWCKFWETYIETHPYEGIGLPLECENSGGNDPWRYHWQLMTNDECLRLFRKLIRTLQQIIEERSIKVLEELFDAHCQFFVCISQEPNSPIPSPNFGEDCGDWFRRLQDNPEYDSFFRRLISVILRRGGTGPTGIDYTAEETEKLRQLYADHPNCLGPLTEARKKFAEYLIQIDQLYRELKRATKYGSCSKRVYCQGDQFGIVGEQFPILTDWEKFLIEHGFGFIVNPSDEPQCKILHDSLISDDDATIRNKLETFAVNEVNKEEDYYLAKGQQDHIVPNAVSAFLFTLDFEQFIQKESQLTTFISDASTCLESP